MYKLTIGENEAGQRLDRFLRKYLRRAPLSAIYRIIRKDLKVNGKRGKEEQMLKVGDELTFYMPSEQIHELAKAMPVKAAKRRFGIAYEDDHILIVDKPAGLLTHGDSREKSNTLTNQVYGYLQQKGEYDPANEMVFHPSPVNRLDRNTSGLVIFGKNAEAVRELTAMLRERSKVRKLYRAIACGSIDEEITIEESLVKDEDRNMVVVTGRSDDEKTEIGRESTTIVRPVKTGRDFTLVELELVTGRTHQIRVHMAHIGHPLAGDPKYGDPKVNTKLKDLGINSQMLNAYMLSFSDEIDGSALAGIAGKVVQAKKPVAFAEAEKKLI